jgi:hypothetical protein
MFSSADLSLAAGKMRKNLLVKGGFRQGFRYEFTESEAASCMHLQCQNHRFRVFEAGYWKMFKISKRASKNFEFDFFIK